ncbi:ATPase/histidine kinase/DNA gyrase B/HSP90 domain protein [uncultured Paludibacter sp.]|nr:ATPase/histidine kinase/DNA gyrase B/HSP90 domain protein [uncultured Paludibacter sp.]
MVDLAMHTMDIVQNSIRAGAKNIEIEFLENSNENTLTFCVKDDGKGMNKEMLAKLSDPFFTTRTTRKIGLGVPFLKMTSEQTGGFLEVESTEKEGTKIKAVYKTDHPDCLPLGDLAGYIVLLLAANKDVHFRFQYTFDKNSFTLDTAELTKEGITDFQSAEIISAIKEYISENLKELFSDRKKGSFLC